jgi:hypothetical protein
VGIAVGWQCGLTSTDANLKHQAALSMANGTGLRTCEVGAMTRAHLGAG